MRTTCGWSWFTWRAGDATRARARGWRLDDAGGLVSGSAAARARTAVAARVAGAGPHHASPAAGALDRVLVAVEERALPRKDSRPVAGRLARVRTREPRLHLGREDPDLLLLVDGEELLAEPAEHVVDDRLRV